MVPRYLGPSTAHPTPATQQGHYHLPDSSESRPRQGGPYEGKCVPFPSSKVHLPSLHRLSWDDPRYTLREETQHAEVSRTLLSTTPRACFPKLNPEKKKKQKHNKLTDTTLTMLTIHGGERWVYKAVHADWELMGLRDMCNICREARSRLRQRI